MKLKVVHLLRKLDTIDRDLEELENLQNAIHENRIYSGRLRMSLGEETTRLKKLKSRILSQVIASPPSTSGGDSGSAGQAGNSTSRRKRRIVVDHPESAGSRPEIVLPRRRGHFPEEASKSASGQKPGEKAKSRKSSLHSIGSGAGERKNAASEKSDPRERVAPFQFRYGQNEEKTEK